MNGKEATINYMELHIQSVKQCLERKISPDSAIKFYQAERSTNGKRLIPDSISHLDYLMCEATMQLKSCPILC